MKSGGLSKFDTKIKERPEVKILVFFSVVGTLAALPFVYVVYLAHWLANRPGVSECLIEGIFAASAVGAIVLMRKTPGALPLANYGLRWRGIATQTALGAGIGLALMSAIFNVLRVTGHYVIDRANVDFRPLEPLVLFLLVAIFEETVFRGYIFVTLEKTWGSFVALTTTSLLFGLAHLVDTVPGVGFGQHLRSAIFIGLEAGVLLNAAFMLTRSLWLGIGIHWAWNFFEGPFYGGMVSGSSPQSPLYLAHTVGSTLITGGGFGPEGGVVCLIICTLAGLVMLRLVVRSGEWHPNPEIAQYPISPETRTETAG